MNENLTTIDESEVFTVVSPNKDITITVNDITEMLNNIAKVENIESLYDISTSRFNTLLLLIGKRLIRPSRLYYTSYNGKNRVDYNTIKTIANIYVYICYVYNKGISLSGFSNLLGVITVLDTSLSWENMDSSLSKIQSFLKKADNELQMSNARDSKQAILQLSYNNYVHGWNGDIRSNEIKASAKSLDDIRRERLAMSDNLSADDGQNPNFSPI